MENVRKVKKAKSRQNSQAWKFKLQPYLFFQSRTEELTSTPRVCQSVFGCKLVPFFSAAGSIYIYKNQSNVQKSMQNRN